MASAMRVFRKFRASDGRIKVTTAFGVLMMAIAIAVFGILPAFAGSGEPSGSGVQPTEVAFGGGSGACDFVNSDAEFELHINNPIPGETTVYSGPDNTEIEITVDADDLYFDFKVLSDDFAAYDVVVNGGSQNTHYDYDGGPGPAIEDTDLHAPTKGGSSNLYKLSHINICYDVFVPNVEGTKFHDRDADGTFDESEEEGLAGWTIVALDSITGDLVRQSTTGADGSYVIGNLPNGNYTICEATNKTGLPDGGDNYEWAWKQSAPATESVLCESEGYEPGGYTIEVSETDPLTTDQDFGNHRQVSVTCDSDNDVVVTLEGADDEPSASVTFPAGCQSGLNGTYTTSFDLGLSADDDVWAQFVVFGGDPNSTQVLTQTIEWAPEPAVYDDTTNQLIVDTTRVLLDLTGDVPEDLEDVTFCHDIDGGDPTSATPQCLDSRTIAEGGDVPEDHIQITEHYKLLGDPGNFR